jgi:hypothetical protein
VSSVLFWAGLLMVVLLMSAQGKLCVAVGSVAGVSAGQAVWEGRLCVCRAALRSHEVRAGVPFSDRP